MDPSRLAWPSVSVAGRPPVTFCVEPAAGDLVAAWLLDHGWISEPVIAAFLDLVEPGAHVVDLGCHLGVFSLPAAAAGARVLAVDANAQHVSWVRNAARRNDFTALEVVHGALAAGAAHVAFVERSIHGHVWSPGDGATPTTSVPAVTVDDLVEQRGWERLDVVKIDVEGSEPAVLAGMARLFARGLRPAIVFECNAPLLPRYGSSSRRLRGALVELGYRLVMVDHLRPGILVEAGPESVQTEAVCDFVALPDGTQRIAGDWTVTPALSLGQVLARTLDSAADTGAGYREHAAQLLADGPLWLRRHPAATAVRWALAYDDDPAVRAAVAPGHERSWASECRDDRQPALGADAGLVLHCEALGLVWPDGQPDHAAPLDRSALTLRDIHLHARAGQLVGLLSPQDITLGSLLIRGLAGRIRPAAGRVQTTRPVTLLMLDELVEPGLTVATNLAVLAAGFGAHVPAVNERTQELLGWAALGGHDERLLADMPDGSESQLLLAASLMAGSSPGLVLVDRLEPELDHAVWERAAQRVAALRAAGATVIQVIGDAGDLLGPADRVLWIADGEAMACGRAEAVLGAADALGAALGAPA